MSRKIAAIVAGTLVIALLAGALIFLKTNPGPDVSLPSGSETGGISLVEEDSSTLQTAKIKNPDDEYTIEKTGDNQWGIKALEGFPQESYRFSSTVVELSSISASEIIAEGSSDLGQFGLDEPSVQVELSFENGKSYSLSIGSDTPDGTGKYVAKTGESTVYMVASSLLSSVSYTRYDYLNLTVVEQETDEDGKTSPPAISSFRISRPDLAKPIVFETVGYEYDTENTASTLRMTSPVNGLLNETAADKYIALVFGMQASRVAALNPSGEEMKKYGLDSPSSVLEIVYGDKKLTLKTGHGMDEDGNTVREAGAASSYYIMREGLNEVFVVAADSVSWIGLAARDLLSSSVALPYVTDVKSIDVTLEQKKHVIEIASSAPAEGASSQEEASQSYTLDGKKVDAKQGGRFYSLLLDTGVQDVNQKQPTGPSKASVVFHMKSGKDIKIEFFVEPDLTTIVSLNGNNAYIGRSGYIDKIARELDNLAKGNGVDTTW